MPSYAVKITAAPDFSSNVQSFGVGSVNNATVTLTVTATDDPATTEIYTLSLHDALPICNASVSTAGSGTVNVTDNDSATVTLSGTTTAVEGGATGSLTEIGRAHV